MNIFEFAFAVENNFEKYLQNCFRPYKRQYTWVSDFCIAMVCEDKGEKGAIKDTYRRAIRDWKKCADCITELAMSLNYLTWFCFQNQQCPWTQKYSKLFTDLYYKSIEDAEKNLKEDEFINMMKQLD